MGHPHLSPAESPPQAAWESPQDLGAIVQALALAAAALSRKELKPSSPSSHCGADAQGFRRGKCGSEQEVLPQCSLGNVWTAAPTYAPSPLFQCVFNYRPFMEHLLYASTVLATDVTHLLSFPICNINSWVVPAQILFVIPRFYPLL